MANIPKVVITIPSPEAIEEALRNKEKVLEELMNNNRKPYVWDDGKNELQELAESTIEFETVRSVPTITDGIIELVTPEGVRVLVTHATSIEDAHQRMLKHHHYLETNETEA